MSELPIFVAQRAFNTFDYDFTFDDLIRESKRRNRIISRPDYFICAKDIFIGAREKQILDISFDFEENTTNCYHIYIIAGDLTKAFTNIPKSYRWISFQHGKSNNYDITYRNLERFKHMGKGAKTPDPVVPQGIPTDADTEVLKRKTQQELQRRKTKTLFTDTKGASIPSTNVLG